jgi:parvulin-like peptidyl-prolyl isomerase
MAKKATKKASLGKVGRVEREQRLNRILVLGSVFVFGLIITMIISGIIYEKYISPPRALATTQAKEATDQFLGKQPIALVEGVELLTKDFQTRVIVERTNLISEYNNYLNFISQLGMSIDQIPANFYEAMINIEYELLPPNIGRKVIDQMVDEIIIKNEAQARGIVVTEEEIEEALQELLGYYPEGTPTPTNTQLPRNTSTLSPTQLALVTITPTTFPTLASVPTEAVPTPTPYTYESYLELRDQYKDEYWSIVEAQLYREKLMDILVSDIPEEEAWVWARHILVEDEATALEVLNLLEEGANFSGLAFEYSTGPSAEQGGDLGWFYEGEMLPDFSQVAFSLAIGEISDPVQTEFGWHIIQVMGQEARPLSPDRILTIKNEARSNWLAEVRETKEITLMDFWQDRIPTEPDIPLEYRISQLVPPPAIEP